MFALTIRMLTQTLFVILVLSFVNCQDRKIIAKLNPGCKNCTAEHTLVYIQEPGSENTIHQIWDFTLGIPTMIFAIGGVNSSITVIWDGTHPKKFLFSETPVYSFATAIDKLYEYDDLEDNGHIDGHNPQKWYSLRHATWRLNNSLLTNEEAMVKMHGAFGGDTWRKGLIEMKLDLLPYRDFAAELPHLIHTANSTLADVTLVNLTASREYNASRYALHFTLVSTDVWSESMEFDVRQSLDDEHTPGVFEIVEIKTPESSKSSDGGFIQFRPVAYTERERSVTSSTNAHISKFNRTSLPSRSTLVTFYKNFDQSNLLVQDMFISFGEAGDGYYKQHNYTSWSFTLGYGLPPVETFSLFITLVICIGLGVPVVMALTTIIVMLVRRLKRSRQENYAAMDN